MHNYFINMFISRIGSPVFRFIMHSDRSNPFLETLEDLEKEIDAFDPSVLVVGGLQMMDNFPFKEGILKKQISFSSELLCYNSLFVSQL